jgi:carbamoyltransferase
VRILAFHSGIHDSSAAAFDEYECVAAVQEERLTRDKASGGLPWLAIDEVLNVAGWTRRDVDAIATTRSMFPVRYFRFSLFKEVDYAVRRWLDVDTSRRELTLLCQRHGTSDSQSLFRSGRFLSDNAFRSDIPIHFANHHEGHALAALFFTDWDNALIYTADGVGDNVSYSIRSLADGKLDCYYGDDRWLVRNRRAPKDSLAMAYGYATRACGFRKDRHEGKLTGLSAHGSPKLAPALSRHYRVNEDGLIQADFRTWGAMEEAVQDICRGQDRETIAASIQAVVEDVCSKSVDHWLKRTGARHLALAGGLFSNVRLNRQLAETLPVDEVFVFPAMGDDGLSIGAALSFLQQRDGLKDWLKYRHRLENIYLGRDYTRAIDSYLSGHAAVRRMSDRPIDVAVEMLRAGGVGAIYTGRMEFGPRALGARSILASPNDPLITDKLNKRLSRSEFMPFAPYVLAEDAEKVFEVTPRNRYAARFMTIACAVRPEWRNRLSGITHIDGSARPQIVRDEDNPLFAGILRRFRDTTGLPVLVNTSFNVHEEPIVNRPDECARALTDGRIDFVVTDHAAYTSANESPRADAPRKAGAEHSVGSL